MPFFSPTSINCLTIIWRKNQFKQINLWRNELNTATKSCSAEKPTSRIYSSESNCVRIKSVLTMIKIASTQTYDYKSFGAAKE